MNNMRNEQLMFDTRTSKEKAREQQAKDFDNKFMIICSVCATIILLAMNI